MAVLFALIALFGWGAGDIFVTIVSRKIGNIASYFWLVILGLIFVSLYIPFAGKIDDFGMFGVAIILNIIHTLGNVSYFRGLEKGNASIIGTLGGAFPLISVILSLFLFREKMNLILAFGIIFTLLGVILVSFYQEGGVKISRKILNNHGIRYGLFTMIAWGIYFGLIRIPSRIIGFFWAGYPMYLIGPFLLLLPAFRKVNLKKVLVDKTIIIFLFIEVILLTLADFSYNLGVISGFTSLVAPIAGAFPVLFVILSRFVFRERLTVQQKAGIGLALAGIVLIGISSI
ncbi:hypothetical protein A2W14_04500 [Candidatus Gottesmanbacteria bacterium RBG_16_37_8]|uniref:EamA domain-containing protein n=1 Tax=Candidatus Gottesmanbacteria bacterium RBG_16_37_8 TaxID=1798371 RepID=A0A1F5YT69_9BACT|nr:MAG: hypothetical protein A2W14_04500 [Candidatus Gottesmanbacteria bacterium RBG_16_37_8]